MAASKMKLKPGPLDVWSVKERLSLASSVLRNGDQNWVSVSRAIKPFGEAERSPEWFSQKNCALQYSELLEKVETPKRKRADRGEIETPGIQIIRKLTIERIEELKKIVLEQQQKYKKLKKDVEVIRTGQCDDRLPEMWATMQAEKTTAPDGIKVETTQQLAGSSKDKLCQPMKLLISPPSVSETEDSTQDSLIEMSNDEDSNQTIPGSSLAFDLSETEVPSPKVHPLSTPGALSKLQTIAVTPVPTFQATPGGNTLTSPAAQQTTLVTNLSGRSTKTTPPSSPLLSSLLKSKHHAPELLQQMKMEVEQGQAPQALAQSLVTSPTVVNQTAIATEALTNQIPDIKKMTSPIKLIVASTDGLGSPSTGAPTLSKLLAVPAMSKKALIGQTAVTVTQSISQQIVETELPKQEVIPQAVEEVVLTSAPSSGSTPDVTELPDHRTVSVESKPTIKEEIIEVKEEVIDSLTNIQSSTEEEIKDQIIPDEGESQSADQVKNDHGEENSENQSGLLLEVEDDLPIKEEPLSPCSSVSSRVSETGLNRTTRRGSKGGKQSKGGRRSTRLTRKQHEEEEQKARLSLQTSEGESSDEERESDGSVIASKMSSTSAATATFSESIPNSPLSQCSDTEDERVYKSWKKSIMLVWRAISAHKYASLFLQAVTNDIAPGYRSIVHRPVDLTLIKKNIESGVLRSTGEFQRDMMLMFTNAIMYNSSDHNVYRMAVEMYNDVLQVIEQYVSTQLMVHANDTKTLRTTSRYNSDKEEDVKKRRTSADQLDGGKSKKRKP